MLAVCVSFHVYALKCYIDSRDLPIICVPRQEQCDVITDCNLYNLERTLCLSLASKGLNHCVDSHICDGKPHCSESDVNILQQTETNVCHT